MRTADIKTDVKQQEIKELVVTFLPRGTFSKLKYDVN